MKRLAPVAMLVAMVLARIAALLALMKLLAVAFGADRFGQLSQVLALSALFSVLAGGGVTNGIVRNMAATGDAAERASWIKASLPIALGAAGLLALAAWLLYALSTEALFPGQDLSFVLVIIAGSQAVVGFGNVALGYLSGTQDIRAFTLANGTGSVGAAGLVAVLAYAGGFRGAAAGCAALALIPALVACAAAARRIPWAAVRRATVDRARVRALLKFGGSTYVAATAVPVVWLFVRSDLAWRQGWDAVGLWQAVARISDAYMQVFGVVFMNYVLPQLAAMAPAERHRRLGSVAALIFGMFGAGIIVLFVFRVPILTGAFSPAFAAAATYVPAQAVGDGFKLVSLLFVYYLMAQNRAGVQAAMEVLQAAVTAAAYLLLVGSQGNLAPVISYAVATGVVMTATLGVAATDRRSRHRASAAPPPAVWGDGPP